MPDVKEERRYVVDARTELQQITESGQTLEVSGKQAISRDQAEDLTTAGLLNGSLPGSGYFENSLTEYAASAAAASGANPHDKNTEEEKGKEKKAKENAKAERLAARSPFEKAHDLMEEISNKFAEADRYALRCDGGLG